MSRALLTRLSTVVAVLASLACSTHGAQRPSSRLAPDGASPPTSPPVAHRAGLERLQFLVGRWALVRPAAATDSAGMAPTAPLAVEPFLNGKYLRLTGRMGGPAFELLISYSTSDRRYALAILDERSGVFDVYEGDFDSAGRLVLTNPQYFRITLQPVSTGGFAWIGSHSPDRGETWRVTDRYQVAPAASSADGFDRLRFLSGAWDAEPWEAGADGRLSKGPPIPLDFTAGLGDRYLELRGAASGVEFRIVLSHFGPGSRYRAAILDSESGYIHLYEGGFDADGRLVLTSPLHSRITITRQPDGGIEWIDDSSVDGGRSWRTNTIYRMHRRR